jgi:hypothetical protein
MRPTNESFLPILSDGRTSLLWLALETDCSVALFDVRAGTPLRKIVMLKRANKLAWNPCEAFNFTIASEDNNLYSFDMRRLDSATNVHKDFVSVRVPCPVRRGSNTDSRYAGCSGCGLFTHRA